MMMTAAQLREARQSLGFSQQQLAIALGISVDTLQNWEQGRRTISYPHLLELAIAHLACETRGETP